MAWQYPTHTCGHDGDRYQAYGRYDDRDRRKAAIESRPCPDCRRATAEKVAQEAGLPLLTGSAKQIVWASDIRVRALRLLPIETATKLRAETSSKWWIDNRHEVQNI